jgi:hypothetical protein
MVLGTFGFSVCIAGKGRKDTYEFQFFAGLRGAVFA